MAMSAEARALQSTRMKEKWLKRKAQAGEVPADPALREAMAKVAMNTPIVVPHPLQNIVVRIPEIENPMKLEHYSNHITINWDTLPMMEAQHFYAALKSEFERAGRILNARSMARTSGYTCFMCKKHFDGNPGFTDFSYVDPATGLSPRIDCCGELCVINYNAMRINQRHQRSLAQAQQERNG